MSKAGDSILQGLRESLDFMKGDADGAVVHRVDIENIDVKAIRKKLGMNQEVFAFTIGASASGVRKWEQGVRTPTGPTRVLLKVMEKEPEAVKRVLEA